MPLLVFYLFSSNDELSVAVCNADMKMASESSANGLVIAVNILNKVHAIDGAS